MVMGIRKPQTPEEAAFLKQVQEQPKEPDAAMVLAKAEELKGQADIIREKREGIGMQLDNENAKADHVIDMFKAQTDRMKVQVAAHEAGAKITKTKVEIEGEELDNLAKIIELRSPTAITGKSGNA